MKRRRTLLRAIFSEPIPRGLPRGGRVRALTSARPTCRIPARAAVVRALYNLYTAAARAESRARLAICHRRAQCKSARYRFELLSSFRPKRRRVPLVFRTEPGIFLILLCFVLLQIDRRYNTITRIRMFQYDIFTMHDRKTY